MSENICSPNQWQTEGKCEACRRRSYCKSVCTARRRFMEAELSRKMRQMLAEKLAERKKSEESAQ